MRVIASTRSVLLLLGLVPLFGTACDEEVVEPPPAVVQLSPADGADDVSIHADITAAFSEPVTIPNVAAPILLRRDGVEIHGSIGLEGGTLTFQPAGALDPGAEYTAVLSAGIQAREGGTATTRDTAWSFSTAGTPPPTLDTALVMPHLRALAHDSMRGRGSGTENELRAARYIRDRFAAMELEPAAGGWFQPFDIPEDNPDSLRGASSQNVLGVLPGAGPLADEWVVVGAHYDHEGFEQVGPDSVVVYNGADDNASGTALLLAIAGVLADYVATGGIDGEARRSVMFQAYGAEEVGLVGSEHYTAHPVEPLGDLSGMLNFDMVGRLRAGEVHISGFWTSDEWLPVLAERNPTGLVLIDKQDCQSCSDYAPFRRAGRPAIWFFTGFHDQYGTPEDDVGRIDADGLVRIGDLAAAAIVHMALRSDLLPFDRVLP